MCMYRGRCTDTMQTALIYTFLSFEVLGLVILLEICEHKVFLSFFFSYCIAWSTAFWFPILLWIYMMWNICDCLVLRWCDCRAFFGAVEEIKGWAHCEQLLRKKKNPAILSCSTEARTGLIGYWFQLHYGESTFLGTNMCSHMLICKCENCLGSKALCWAVLSLSIWNAEEPHFQLKSMAPVPLGKSSWLLQLYWALDSLQLCCALGLASCL